MPVLHLVSQRPLSGKTAVAVGLGQGLAGLGHQVQFLRTGAGPTAASDAATMAAYTFAASPGVPVPQTALTPDSGATVLVEWDAGELPPAGQVLLGRDGTDLAQLVCVVRRAASVCVDPQLVGLGDDAGMLDRPVGVKQRATDDTDFGSGGS